jgi:hypothetical protein
MKGFLVGRLGEEQGERVALQQQERLSQLLGRVTGKSNGQMKTLKTSVLPFIALYQVLREAQMDTRILDDYIVHLSERTGGSYRRLERLPFSFALFRMATARKMRADNWNVTFDRNDSQVIQFTVTKCLWHDTCVALGCPEVCEKFCDADDHTLGALDTITFERSKTLGKGGDSCDFHLINRRKSRD